MIPWKIKSQLGPQFAIATYLHFNYKNSAPHIDHTSYIIFCFFTLCLLVCLSSFSKRICSNRTNNVELIENGLEKAIRYAKILAYEGMTPGY